MNAFKGLFITLDGPNGVGKSTIMGNLCEKLTSRGFDVRKTKEPTDSSIGQFLRQSEEDYRGNTLACIAAADRYYHIEHEIIPALHEEKIVLSDRYVESSLVLQWIDNVDVDFIWTINKNVIIPDLSVILLASPDALNQRLNLRSERSFFERKENARQQELDYYRHAAKFLEKQGFNIYVLDNESTSIEENSEKIVMRIVDLYNRSRMN